METGIQLKNKIFQEEEIDHKLLSDEAGEFNEKRVLKELKIPEIEMVMDLIKERIDQEVEKMKKEVELMESKFESEKTKEKKMMRALV